MEENSYNLDLKVWKAIGDLHHKMFWLRQKELSQYNITARQLHILEVIESLGSKASSTTESRPTVPRPVHRLADRNSSTT